jgi:two-component system KDP operon response regulator KdpE
MAERILVVEDSEAMRNALARALEMEAYEVFMAADGEAGLAEFARARPDLVIMDLSMPRMDGLEAIRRLREFSAVPILVLSVRGTEEDKVIGLNIGADDYLAKPFGANELLARVRALLRRRTHETAIEGPQVLRLGGGALVIDRSSGQVLLDGQMVHLTPIESRVLMTLAGQPGKTFTRKDLIRAVWGTDSAGTSQNLKLYILYLRRKIEPNPEEPRFLLTLRGFGYTLTAV